MTWCIRIIFLVLCLVAALITDAPLVAFPVFFVMAFLGSYLFCCFSLSIFVLAYLFYFPYYSSLFPVITLLLFAAVVFRVKGRLKPDDHYVQYIEHLKSIILPIYFILYLGIGIYILKRDSDISGSVVFLGILLVFHLQYRFLWFRLTKIKIAELALITVFLLFSVAILEIGMRILWEVPPGNQHLYMPHPKYVFLLNPGGGVSYPVRTEENSYPEMSFTVSQQGFRDRMIPEKKSDEFRVLLLGDSFTMGSAVAEEHTISAYLEKILRSNKRNNSVTVVNGGINGGGPLQSLGTLRERGLYLEPNAVIMELFLFNDFDDCLMPIGKAQRNFYAPFRQQVAIFMRQNTFPYWLEFNMFLHSSAYRKIRSSKSFSKPWIGDVLSSSRLFEKPIRVQSFPMEPDIPAWIDINRKEWYPELNEAMDLLVSYVNEMHGICADNNISFAVYCVPDYHEVNTSMWNTGVELVKDEFDVVRYKAMRDVEKRLKSHGIPMFSVLEPLQEKQNAIEEIYYIYDGHPTPKGNEIIAQKICDYLLEAERPATMLRIQE